MEHIYQSVVRIEMGENGETNYGTGFFISDQGHILTCSHVVLSEGLQESGAEIPEEVRVVFLGDKKAPIETMGQVLMDYWRDCREGDIAVLQVNMKQFPTARPLSLCDDQQAPDLFFRTLGFPADSWKIGLNGQGPILQGYLNDPDTDEPLSFLQLSSNETTTGFSGAPVIEKWSGMVLGMINGILSPDQFLRHGNVGFARTARSIVNKVPELEVLSHYHVRHFFTTMPLDAQLVDAIRIRTEPLKLRVLIESSSKKSEFNMNAEIAAIVSTLRQVCIASPLKDNFDVKIFLPAGDQARVISGRTGEDQSVFEPYPEPAGLDWVILLVWHDLGVNRAMEKWIAAGEKAAFRRQVYNRIGKFAPSVNDPLHKELLAGYEETKIFLRDNFEQRITEYAEDEFARTFELDLQGFLRASLELNAKGVISASLPEGSTEIFMGLSSYGEKDSALFFGRRKQEAELLNKFDALDKGGVLAVFGASGAGKSSLLKAGLLHRLGIEGMLGQRHSKVIELSMRRMDVGMMAAELADSLVSACKGLSEPGVLKKRIREHLTAGKDIQEVLTALRQQEPEPLRLVLFVDQFEELFTLVTEKTQKDIFIRVIVEAVASGVTVVIGMRNDYFHKCAEYPDFHEALKAHICSVIKPDAAALYDIVRGPVIFSGYRFQNEDLPLAILHDLKDSEGILPLLSYAMQRLVSKSGNGVLTEQAYKDLGYLPGIIQAQAEEAVAPLRQRADLPYRESFHYLFSRLITISENDKPTKKPAFCGDDVWEDNPIARGAREIMQALKQERLLFTDMDPARRPVVEIAHESLLENWQDLAEWITVYKADLMLLRRMELAAADWWKAREQATDELTQLEIDDGHLWPHERLQQLEEAKRKVGWTPPDDPAKAKLLADFTYPEHDRLIKLLSIARITHERRSRIGDRLDQLGDRRRGVGRLEDGLPDIVWCKVKPGSTTLRINDAAGMQHIPMEVKEPFYIAKYPITFSQFNVFAGTTSAPNPDYHQDEWWQGLHLSNSRHHVIYPQPGPSNRPAQYVSWYQAVAFCRWLTRQYDQRGWFREPGEIRLPREWEWQLAASGGLEGYDYPWGGKWDPALCCNTEGIRQLMAVGLYPLGKSPVGAMDMSGNVYEWCLNKFDDWSNDRVSGDEKRVTRGGFYSHFPRFKTIEETYTVYHRLDDPPTAVISSTNQRISTACRPICTCQPHSGVVEDWSEG